MILRDYQEQTVEENLAAKARGAQAVLNGLFTGAGKTVVFTEMARRNPGRTLMVVPLREVAWQTIDKVREITGEDPELEMADFMAGDMWGSKVVVASKQTLLSRRGGEHRYRRFTDFDLVIADEAHMLYSEPVLEMFRYWQNCGAMIAGFTATPFRQDGRAMLNFYEEVIANRDMQWGVDNGWSSGPVCKIARVQSMSLDGVSISGGDFNQEQLRKEVEKEATLHRIALITEQERMGQTVVFTPSVGSAKGVCHFLNNNYNVPATYVYGTMPEDERREALRRFKSKEVQVLVNCQVVAIGFDYPPTATLILGRPTKSRAFWLQAVGRATRPLPGTVDFPNSTPESRKAAIAASDKPYFKIVDCTDSSLDHRLVTAVDMFVNYDAAVKDVVKKAVAASDAPMSQEEMDALALAELERQRIAKELEERRRLTIGRASGHVVGRDVDLEFQGKRCVGTYTNPLRGKYAGVKMSELPYHYVDWGSKTLNGWVRSMFVKELTRRWEKKLSS